MNGKSTFDVTRKALETGTTTVERVTGEFLEEIGRRKRLNAFLSVFHEKALVRARNVDKKIAEGRAGTLAGMVVAVKDILCMKGEVVTCGSKMLQNFVSPYDATALKRLLDADAVIVGKTNLDEFAMGSSTENSAYGSVLNPLDESKVPGGSSGGSCVAVAAGMSHTALGTDTGGSIRQPASFCGVVGLKPTYGRVSRYGMVALASSFDQIGPFAHTVADAASVLQVIAGHDESDSTSADVPVPDYLSSLTKDVKGMKIGLPREAFGEGLNEEVRSSIEKAIDSLRGGGAEIVEVGLPHSEYTISTYYILMTAEASSNLARYDGARYGYRSPGVKDLTEMYVNSRSEGLGAEVTRRIMLGTYVLSAGYYDAYYRKAQKVRRLIQNDFLNAFKIVDCILMPTAPTTAFSVGEKVDDPLAMYLSDVYTVSANLAGIPAISVPCGVDSRGLPIGVQLLGKQFDEGTILRVGDFLQT
ncbi:MAG: Asp-tRNA(Asn)/Glu-tRNA(Gln) amidotransferase subunit GatA [Bacteroidetes bacterium]|nr:Asp-tRNA(Asn)/Glu-tRNA(Gln) amidotransferase subunit GatA [Bacteroidota bacterium]MCW5895315.1 Asp-tRNA(Asn)/Glu-tRNA(Gln) amidotransferase subunit GatA [Bacteroidota bacterium]